MTDLRQAWPSPSTPRPIVVIGAGAIVRTAHLPAYARRRYPVSGVFDLRTDTARGTAAMFGVPVFTTLDDACAVRGAVFDVAVPGDQILSILCRLPVGAAVLMQKPMGEHLDAARRILDVCRARRLVAAVNFQLRFSPNMLAVEQLVEGSRLGAITDIEVRDPSGIDAFDRAAVNALLSSNPTQVLPPDYPTESAFFTVTFLYNEEPPAGYYR